MDEGIGLIFICITIALVVSLLIREIVCWYWKINRTIFLLESINEKLDRLPSSEK